MTARISARGIFSDLLGRDALEVAPAAGPGQRPHPPDVLRALVHSDRAPGVEQVEHVRALEGHVVRRQRQPGLEEPPALPLEVVEVPRCEVGVGLLELILRELNLISYGSIRDKRAAQLENLGSFVVKLLMDDPWRANVQFAD